MQIRITTCTAAFVATFFLFPSIISTAYALTPAGNVPSGPGSAGPIGTPNASPAIANPEVSTAAGPTSPTVEANTPAGDTSAPTQNQQGQGPGGQAPQKLPPLSQSPNLETMPVTTEDLNAKAARVGSDPLNQAYRAGYAQSLAATGANYGAVLQDIASGHYNNQQAPALLGALGAMVNSISPGNAPNSQPSSPQTNSLETTTVPTLVAGSSIPEVIPSSAAQSLLSALDTQNPELNQVFQDFNSFVNTSEFLPSPTVGTSPNGNSTLQGQNAVGNQLQIDEGAKVPSGSSSSPSSGAADGSNGGSENKDQTELRDKIRAKVLAFVNFEISKKAGNRATSNVQNLLRAVKADPGTYQKFVEDLTDKFMSHVNDVRVAAGARNVSQDSALSQGLDILPHVKSKNGLQSVDGNLGDASVNALSAQELSNEELKTGFGITLAILALGLATGLAVVLFRSSRTSNPIRVSVLKKTQTK